MSACLPHLIHDLRHDRVVVNRKTNRIGARLRFRAGCRPALSPAVWPCWQHSSTGLQAADCLAATSGFVVLTAITVWGLQRRAASPTPAARCRRDVTVETAAPAHADNAATPTELAMVPSSGCTPIHPPLPGSSRRQLPVRRFRRLPATGCGASAELAVALGLHVLSTAEVASVLRVDAQEIAKAISSGELPGNRIGGDWRVDLGALRRWLQGRYPAPGALSGPAAHAAFGDEQN